MRTIFFISVLDIANGNSAGGIRICNMMKAISVRIDVSVEYLRYNGSPKSFFTSLSDKIANAEQSSIYFYPSHNPMFEILFLLWAKLFYSGNIFCDINEVRKYESSYSRKYNPIKRLIIKMFSIIGEKLSSYYDGLICISKFIQEYFLKYNRNSIVVPILSDIPEKMPEHSAASMKFSFAFVGSVCLEKENLRELLKGFALLKEKTDNWSFNVYGSPPFNDYEEINEYINMLGLNDNVIFHGPVKQSKVSRILSSSDCLILPRRDTPQNHYGFSTKLSEYAVSGTPIILTDTGVLKDFFQDGKNCLLVNGYSAEGFYEQMTRVLQMSVEDKIRIAKGAYDVACWHFDYMLFSDLLADFLR